MLSADWGWDPARGQGQAVQSWPCFPLACTQLLPWTPSAPGAVGLALPVLCLYDGCTATVCGAALLPLLHTLPPAQVVPPFHLMPREVLEGSCNAVLRALVNSLLPLFLRQLADDYGKWASTDSYRALRAARTKPLS